MEKSTETNGKICSSETKGIQLLKGELKDQ